jgi:hypothetical protein
MFIFVIKCHAASGDVNMKLTRCNGARVPLFESLDIVHFYDDLFPTRLSIQFDVTLERGGITRNPEMAV